MPSRRRARASSCSRLSSGKRPHLPQIKPQRVVGGMAIGPFGRYGRFFLGFLVVADAARSVTGRKLILMRTLARTAMSHVIMVVRFKGRARPSPSSR